MERTLVLIILLLYGVSFGQEQKKKELVVDVRSITIENCEKSPVYIAIGDHNYSITKGTIDRENQAVHFEIPLDRLRPWINQKAIRFVGFDETATCWAHMNLVGLGQCDGFSVFETYRGDPAPEFWIFEKNGEFNLAPWYTLADAPRARSEPAQQTGQKKFEGRLTKCVPKPLDEEGPKTLRLNEYAIRINGNNLSCMIPFLRWSIEKNFTPKTAGYRIDK